MRPITTFLASALLLASTSAHAFPQLLNDWFALYGASSGSANDASCQLCHANANGGSPWNAYGWALRNAIDDLACDADQSGDISINEAFVCIEPANSDQDLGANDNLTEMVDFSSQPGWALGNCNFLFSIGGAAPGNPAPMGIGLIDPAGTDPVVDCPTDPDPDPDPTDPMTLQVLPGESIQAAIDTATPGSTIFIAPGVYHETAHATNALSITKSGIRLIGQSSGNDRVILENSGTQRNGIVVVPAARTECMSCHTTMAPPFTLRPDAPAGDPGTDPVIHGLEINGITIRNFVNNGLFTERVDNFKIIDVESIDNRNYGIFPTLSSNGLVTRSFATGALDSGIWVETSENVQVTHNLVEGNVNGFEVSNSDDILIAYNEARNNTVGVTLFVLTDLFDERPDADRITVRNNYIHDNNEPNNATPGSLLSFLPPGMGIAVVGPDTSLIMFNRVENNDFAGIVIADYCLALFGSDFDCNANPPPVGYDGLPDHTRVMRNTLTNNGTNPGADNPFAFAAADLALFLTLNDGNCYLSNRFDTYFGFSTMPVCDAPGDLDPTIPILRPDRPRLVD